MRVWVWVLVMAAGDSLLIQERAIDLTQRIFAFYILFDLYKVRSVFGVYFFARIPWHYPRPNRCRLIAAIMRECVYSYMPNRVHPLDSLAYLSLSFSHARAVSLSHTHNLSPPHTHPLPFPPPHFIPPSLSFHSRSRPAQIPFFQSSWIK